MSQAEPYRVARAIRARYEAITGITDRFCDENLNGEYAELLPKVGGRGQPQEVFAAQYRT